MALFFASDYGFWVWLPRKCRFWGSGFIVFVRFVLCMCVICLSAAWLINLMVSFCMIWYMHICSCWINYMNAIEVLLCHSWFGSGIWWADGRTRFCCNDIFNFYIILCVWLVGKVKLWMDVFGFMKDASLMGDILWVFHKSYRRTEIQLYLAGLNLRKLYSKRWRLMRFDMLRS